MLWRGYAGDRMARAGRAQTGSGGQPRPHGRRAAIELGRQPAGACPGRGGTPGGAAKAAAGGRACAVRFGQRLVHGAGILCGRARAYPPAGHGGALRGGAGVFAGQTLAARARPLRRQRRHWLEPCKAVSAGEGHARGCERGRLRGDGQKPPPSGCGGGDR